MRLLEPTGALHRRVIVTLDDRIIDQKDMPGTTTFCDLKIKPGCVVELFDDDRSIGVYTPENGWE